MFIDKKFYIKKYYKKINFIKIYYNIINFIIL